MTDRELMQQALDALINAKGYIFYNVLDDTGNRYDIAIEALRARLAQPEPAQREWMEQERALGYREGHQAALKQREWKGLTDEEIESLRHLIDWTAGWSYVDFAKSIEAKLREKNEIR